MSYEFYYFTFYLIYTKTTFFTLIPLPYWLMLGLFDQKIDCLLVFHRFLIMICPHILAHCIKICRQPLLPHSALSWNLSLAEILASLSLQNRAIEYYLADPSTEPPTHPVNKIKRDISQQPLVRSFPNCWGSKMFVGQHFLRVNTFWGSTLFWGSTNVRGQQICDDNIFCGGQLFWGGQILFGVTILEGSKISGGSKCWGGSKNLGFKFFWG